MSNHGARNVAGVDISLTHRMTSATLGKLKTSLNGTYLTKSEEQLLKNGVFTNNLGVYANDYPTPKWKHNLSANWSKGDWDLTLVNKFQLHYRDALAYLTTPTAGAAIVKPHGTPGYTSRDVGSYSTYDMQASYAGVKNIVMKMGVINLFNKAPNVSNQTGYFRGFDQSVDATGRYVYASLSYGYK
jgi:iron complex outermembrane receptor protein